ncbi:hypothetical protein MKX03_008351 [Papaver bracteatum]|nr:hypothetical protein MKX03_008351 [Papaver bracteatum]
MSNFTTQLVVALSLCLLLLSFSYSVEATARSIADYDAEATTNYFQCKQIRKPCKRDRDCDLECSLTGYDMRGRCVHALRLHHVEKIDVDRFVIHKPGCCCEV